jgi:hypothetical protein
MVALAATHWAPLTSMASLGTPAEGMELVVVVVVVRVAMATRPAAVEATAVLA